MLVPSPFSDLSRSKLRPAVALADADRGDWILCQITSRPYGDRRAITLSDENVRRGGLQRTRYARPGKLFNASHDLMVRQVGVLKAESFRSIIEAVVEWLQSGLKS